MLVVGIGAGDDNPFGSFTQYFIGDFDGECFHNDNPAERVLLMDGRRLAIAWLSNWLYANRIPEAACR